MALSNTAVPRYYGEFREAVLRGEIPVNREISMEMNRIDALIENPNFYYDDTKLEGFILFCEKELTLTDGSDLHLLFTFKLWAEQILCWYYFVDRSVWNHKTKKFETKKAVLDRCTRCGKIDVRSVSSSVFLECRYLDDASDHDCSHNETSRRSDESFQDSHHACRRSAVQILDPRVDAEHDRQPFSSAKTSRYEEGHREFPHWKPSRSPPHVDQ
jgi:hypothetical protein